MKTEEIVKELKYISTTLWRNGCGRLGALDELIDTLSPKPLFIPGPAKLRNGWDAKIYEVFDDLIHGYYLPETGKKLLYCWGINGLLMGNSTTKSDRDLLPNNEPEKVYGPQECNETVKTCENCDCETVKCFACHNYSEWEPFLTDGKLWDRVKAVEKAHRDAADSKCNKTKGVK